MQARICGVLRWRGGASRVEDSALREWGAGGPGEGAGAQAEAPRYQECGRAGAKKAGVLGRP